MESTISIIVSITAIVGFIATAIGWAVKYGSDQKELESANKLQDMRIENLIKDCTLMKDHLKEKIQDLTDRHNEEKSKNATQHEDFYRTRDDMTAVKTQMEHILAGIEEIKGRLPK